MAIIIALIAYVAIVTLVAVVISKIQYRPDVSFNIRSGHHFVMRPRSASPFKEGHKAMVRTNQCKNLYDYARFDNVWTRSAVKAHGHTRNKKLNIAIRNDRRAKQKMRDAAYEAWNVEIPMWETDEFKYDAYARELVRKRIDDARREEYEREMLEEYYSFKHIGNPENWA